MRARRIGVARIAGMEEEGNLKRRTVSAMLGRSATSFAKALFSFLRSSSDSLNRMENLPCDGMADVGLFERD